MTRTRSRLAGTALGIVAAWVTDLTILFVADFGAPVRVVTGWSPDGAEITVFEILITAAAAIGIAGVALWWWDRRSSRALHHWSIAVMALAAISAVPLWRLDVDTGSKAALTLMHLATGACAILGQRLQPTSSPTPRPSRHLSREPQP